MKKTAIRIRTKNPELLPVYASEEAAGADVRAANESPIVIAPGSFARIPTGLFLEIPSGYEVQIRPRSGLALNHQITVLNSPGTIDSDYRGEIQIILINHGTKEFSVTYGMRIAQMVLSPVVQAECVYTEEELTSSLRGTNGFGSSGLH
jgi:dUTP pyrophosphatase